MVDLTVLDEPVNESDEEEVTPLEKTMEDLKLDNTEIKVSSYINTSI